MNPHPSGVNSRPLEPHPARGAARAAHVLERGTRTVAAADRMVAQAPLSGNSDIRRDPPRHSAFTEPTPTIHALVTSLVRVSCYGPGVGVIEGRSGSPASQMRGLHMSVLILGS